jgi:phage tail sheath gpL-like
MDSVVLKDIPTNVRVPGVYFEVDSSRANQGLPGMPRRILVMGDKTPAGTELAGVPKRILDAAQGPALYGYGSPIARMLSEVRKHNSNTELWAMAGAGGGVQGGAQLQIQLTPYSIVGSGEGGSPVQRTPWYYNFRVWKGNLGPFQVAPYYQPQGVGDATSQDIAAWAAVVAEAFNTHLAQSQMSDPPVIQATAIDDLITLTTSDASAAGSWWVELDNAGGGATDNSPNFEYPLGYTFAATGSGDSGTAATGSIQVSVDAALTGGTLALYVAGRRLAVNVLASDTSATLAARIAVAINADVYLPVTAAASAGSVTLTAKWGGISSNDCDLRLNYYPDEQTPNGVTLTFTALSGGSGSPDMLALLAALGDEPFTAIVTPWTDSSTLATVENWLEERYGPMDPKPGHIWAAQRGVLSALVSAGTNRNSQFSTLLGVYGVPEPAYLWAASAAALCEYEATIDPARPLQQLELKRLAPALSQRMTRSERETLLNSGIATFTVSADGSVFTERMITTYQVNNLDAADVTWLDLETVNTVDAIRYAVRYRIASKFPRMKLADNGTQFAPGQPIVTPSVIRAELVSLFREMEAAGWVENFEQFKSDLQVVRSSSDRNRVNVIFPPDLVNQLRVVAGSIQFRL